MLKWEDAFTEGISLYYPWLSLHDAECLMELRGGMNNLKRTLISYTYSYSGIIKIQLENGNKIQIYMSGSSMKNGYISEMVVTGENTNNHHFYEIANN